jgi:Ricin-type beta-trefoil lectin domain
MNMHYRILCLLLLGLVCAFPVHGAQFVSAASGSCMNLPEHGGTAPDGTPVRLFHCHDTTNQVWTVGSGQINSSFGACLDIQGSAPTAGAPIIVVTCNGRPSQKWSISNGQIVGLGGKCLDVSGGSTSDTTPLILATCSSSASQQWSVQ